MESKDFKIVCELQKKVEDGTFFRFAVKKNEEEKALFWFTLFDNKNIYIVNAKFTAKEYSWISLYIKIEHQLNTERYYPSYAYMETYSLKMDSNKCRDIIKCFEEASCICDIITDFFKNRMMEGFEESGQ